jgi:CDP-paratose 2-epimerase
VRDNIHAADVASAFAAFHRKPRAGAVYNLGGGRHSNCSMLEAITLCERISGRSLEWTLAEQPRVGDHRWWISDLGEFRRDYPEWSLVYDLESTLQEIYERNAERWVAEAVSSIASG